MLYKKINLLSIVLMTLMLCPYITMAWTVDGEWESGSSIIWDVPYQSQAYFRNWSTSCMATSGAMIINFMYSGARISEFSGGAHPWSPITITYPYETTGQRVYSLGIITGNEYGRDDGNLLNYLKNYPKNGKWPTLQYYYTLEDGFFGPLKNETLNSVGTIHSVTNVYDEDTNGVINALISYLSKKHYIKIEELGDNYITNIRNDLYKGPVIVSVGRYKENNYGKHVIVIKGVDSDGNFIANDPWGADIFSLPDKYDKGKDATYEVNGSSLKAYGEFYEINYAYSVPVEDNFNRPDSPFSPWNIPVEAALTFNYDASGNPNENYNGDGDYADIRNGFVYWHSELGEWYYFYDISSVLGFPFTTTVQGSSATTFARWTPYFPRPGRYRVLVGFYPDLSNSSEVNYIVLHRDGQDTVPIDQTNDIENYEVRGNIPNNDNGKIVYKSLGNYYFSNFGGVKVVNSSNVSGDINVDIVRFAYPPFPDINKNEWYYDYVLCLYDLGIVSGDFDGHFRPIYQVNRAEFIEMAVLALELSQGKELNRATLPSAWNVNLDDRFKPFIEKAYAYKNYEIGFWFWEYERMAFWSSSESPDWGQGITREEAAHIVMNALKLEPYDSDVSGDFMFTDVGNYSPYKEWIYSVKEVEVIEGYNDNSYKPDNHLNRAEASKMIFKLLDFFKYFDTIESIESCKTCADKG
ncbi:MAG: S-layer homology domain-containing protein [Candidatus Thorarchaeota archaeon]